MSHASEVLKFRKKINSLARNQDPVFHRIYSLDQVTGRVSKKSDWKELLKLQLANFFSFQKPCLTPGWEIGIQQSPLNGSAIAVWSDIKDMGIARKACMNLNAWFMEHQCQAAIITSMEDFNFYSRLGWMVEYIPLKFGKSYARKKSHYLALRYEECFHIPLSFGLKNTSDLTTIMTFLFECNPYHFQDVGSSRQ